MLSDEVYFDRDIFMLAKRLRSLLWQGEGRILFVC